jgi:hypothetical protein
MMDARVVQSYPIREKELFISKIYPDALVSAATDCYIENSLTAYKSGVQTQSKMWPRDYFDPSLEHGTAYTDRRYDHRT